ncbi:MAG: PHP domain-containing protein [Bacilli bacterium]
MEKELMDLHIHTNYSDGEKSPVGIYGMARVKRLSTFAITDHDSVLGAKQLEKMNIKDINFINGVELSAKCSFGQLHILGYDLDLNNTVFINQLDELRLNSQYNLKLVIDILYQSFNIRFNKNDIDKLFSLSRTVNRVDLARLLVNYGVCSSVKEAFDKYLIVAHHKISDQTKNLDVQEAIELIHSASGIPVLAHNCTLKFDYRAALSDYVGELANMGLMGIEAYYSTFTPDQTNYSLLMAERYNLLVSGGSDYHGPNVKKDIELATGIKHNLKIKQLSLVDYINKRRGL